MKLYTHFTKFNQNNGISSSNIRKILNDQYGFIWVATQDGLNRFDGNNFLIFNSTAKGIGQVTFGSDFHDIVLDKKILIMHPGPINRGVEITSDVADRQNSIILNQVENGVAVRMAVLFLLAQIRGFEQ